MLDVIVPLLRDSRTFHFLAKMRKASQEEFMVVTISIATLSDSTKTPSICLPNKRRKLGMLEVGWDNPLFKLPRFQDSPGSSMGHPSNDVRYIMAVQNGVHLGWEVRNSSRRSERCQRIWVSFPREVTIVKERGRKNFSLGGNTLLRYWRSRGRSSCCRGNLIRTSGLPSDSGLLDGDRLVISGLILLDGPFLTSSEERRHRSSCSVFLVGQIIVHGSCW
jgi:hypothetical protein